VGASMKPTDLLEQHHLPGLLEQKDVEQLESMAAMDDVAPAAVLQPLLQKAAKRCNVVVTTCISSANWNLMGPAAFHRVLLDEAAPSITHERQVEAVKEMCKPGSKCYNKTIKRFILRSWEIETLGSRNADSGDDRQLPATIISIAAKAHGLDKSLFERLLGTGVVDDDNGFVQLDVQRRMHSSIASFPSQRFYGGQIMNGCCDEDRPEIAGFNWPGGGNCRVCFIDSSLDGGMEEAAGTSIQNHREAELLVQVLAHILEANERSTGSPLGENDVAAIAAYSAQRSLIKRNIHQGGYPGARTSWTQVARHMRVDTVDGFQGMERELILVSTTRSSFSGGVGFLGDARRTNVLLTRARRGLIVFGDYRTLMREDKVWQPWLRWAKEKNALVSARALHTVLNQDWR